MAKVDILEELSALDAEIQKKTKELSSLRARVETIRRAYKQEADTPQPCKYPAVRATTMFLIQQIGNQKKLAEMLGVHETAVKHWKNGYHDFSERNRAKIDKIILKLKGGNEKSVKASTLF